MPNITDSDKMKLQDEFAKLYKSGILMKYLCEREDKIYKIWKSGVGEKGDIARGRSIEIESLKNKLQECHKEDEKARKLAEIKNKKAQAS